MSNTDQRPAPTVPVASPPSYLRRHPILAGFGVLSGLSLFAALWPVSAIVVAVAVAGHATGLDRSAWALAERVAARVVSSIRHQRSAPAPEPPAPTGPEPSTPAPASPRREVHSPAAPAVQPHRHPRAHTPIDRRAARPRRPKTAEPQVGAGVDGPGA